MKPQGRIAIVGGAGAQGQETLRFLRAFDPELPLVAVDIAFDDVSEAECHRLNVATETLDVLADREKLVNLVSGCRVVANFAGPFYRLGTVVLNAAIECGVDYLDICDDVDACEVLLQRSNAAAQKGIKAITGMGAAPGVTNILVKAARDYLGAPEGLFADISWCAPGSDFTPGIFQHTIHCFATALKGSTNIPPWEDLEPREVIFPDPVGPVEVVRLGHPESHTIPEYLGMPCYLRGGSTTPEILRRTWHLGKALEEHDQLQDAESLARAWDELSAIIPPPNENQPDSGMVIDVVADGDGIRFESATSISMEQSTAVPAAAGAMMLYQGQFDTSGVHPPEALSVPTFFRTAGSISPGGGGLVAYRLEKGRKTSKLSIGSFFAEQS